MPELRNTVRRLPIIPVELYDAVVELIDDKTTLRACALVSRSSVKMAQRLLFSTVQLNPPGSSDLQQNSCQRFHAVISRSPYLATYVRHLSIIDGDRNSTLSGTNLGENIQEDSSLSQEAYQYMWMTKERTLSSVISRLVNLESLLIQGSSRYVSWGEFSSEAQDSLLTLVRRPQLKKIEFLGTFGFIPLLRCAPGLTSLRLFGNDMSWQDHSMTLGVKTKACQLESLDVAFGLDHIIVDIETDSWLDLSKIRTLILRGDVVRTRTDLAFPKHILQSSESLEHLYLCLDTDSPFRLFKNLAFFPHLRSLYINALKNIGPMHESYQKWFLDLLATIPNTNQIETIAFRISFTQPFDIFTVNGYNHLDKSLARPELRQLKSIRVNPGKVDPIKFSTYHKLLPLASAKLILTIEEDAKWI